MAVSCSSLSTFLVLAKVAAGAILFDNEDWAALGGGGMGPIVEARVAGHLGDGSSRMTGDMRTSVACGNLWPH